MEFAPVPIADYVIGQGEPAVVKSSDVATQLSRDFGTPMR